VYVIGIAHDRAAGGQLSIQVENVVFCAASPTVSNPVAGPGPSGDGKRRRFGPSTVSEKNAVAGGSTQAAALSQVAGSSSRTLSALDAGEFSTTNG
jgi:hypothetical protein